MTFKQLQYFMAVARTLSFTEAARDLFISQPALSRSIAELEKELRVGLLTRDHHSVSLTPAGTLLASELPKLKMDLERLLILVRQTEDGIMGKLQVGMMDGQKIDDALLVSFDYFKQSVPLVELSPRSLSSDELIDRLLRDKLDITVSLDYTALDRPELEKLELDTVANCIAVPLKHPLSGRKVASLTSFSGDTFITAGNEDSVDMKYLQDVCRKAGFKPNLRIVPDISTQLLWIESGLGISLFNEKSMAFSGAGLKAVHLNDLPPRRLILTWKKDSANPSVRLFVHLMSCCL